MLLTEGNCSERTNTYIDEILSDVKILAAVHIFSSVMLLNVPVRAQNWAFCTGMSSMLAISHLLNAFWRSGNESVQVSSN